MTLFVLLLSVLVIAFLYGIVNVWITNFTDTQLVVVMVMGDVDHSPRMKSHAESIRTHLPNAKVILAGYGKSSSEQGIMSLRRCPQPTGILKRVIFDTLTIISFLFVHLSSIPTLIIVQNPPCIPLIPISYLYSRLTKCKLLIDWHNLGHCQLALRQQIDHELHSTDQNDNPPIRNSSSFLVDLYYLTEIFCGRLANYNLCVSTMMKEWLYDNGIDCVDVFYDRPRSIFNPFKFHSYEEKIEKLAEIRSSDTNFRELAHSLRERNHLLVVTSTSWSLDEPFDVLYRAIQLYEQSTLPDKLPLCVLATGKGALKDYWASRNADDIRSDIMHSKIWMGWLSESDYTKILSLCDIGVSLHRSASGMDLPMKILDMLGSGLHVFALDYGQCLNELCDQYGNDRITTFPADPQHLCHLLLNAAVRKDNRETANMKSFSDEWDDVVKNIILQLCPGLQA